MEHEISSKKLEELSTYIIKGLKYKEVCVTKHGFIKIIRGEDTVCVGRDVWYGYNSLKLLRKLVISAQNGEFKFTFENFLAIAKNL